MAAPQATCRWLLAAAALGLLGGCTVITVASTAVGVTAGVVGLAADAAIGTARIAGKGIGMAAEAMLEDDAPAPPDASGVDIRYRITPEAAP